jgi:hypothetical protein
MYSKLLQMLKPGLLDWVFLWASIGNRYRLCGIGIINNTVKGTVVVTSLSNLICHPRKFATKYKKRLSHSAETVSFVKMLLSIIKL